MTGVDLAPIERRLAMSYSEFLSQTEESAHVEWVAGEAIFFVPPTERHQDTVLFLGQLLGLRVRGKRLGKLIVAPFEMKLSATGNSREPDLLFVSQKHLERLNGQRLLGPADLAIEVISDDSVGRDRGDKFYEYQLGGVQEYWILDPRATWQRIDGFSLQGGRYRAILPDSEGRLHSQVIPGFWFEESWLLTDELPDPLSLLQQS